MSQFVVRAFNEEQLRFLICTSTLIEGVNTRAKNVVIWDSKIANRPLDFFTFNNIRGRSGRMFHHFVGRVFLFKEPPTELQTYVNFPTFTQDTATPDSLLIQIDTADLLEPARKRIEKYTDAKVLTLKTLRDNKSIDPDAQVSLAKHIDDNVDPYWPQLAWDNFPTFEQLKFAYELLWKFLVPQKRKKAGVASGFQLAVKTWQLYRSKDVALRIKAELKPGRFAAKTSDEAVERVLRFDRNWAGFRTPTAAHGFVTDIQHEILSARKLPFGNYSVFVGRLENLFRPAVVAALDEYGVPLQTAERIHTFLRTNDDLDEALANLKRLEVAKLPVSTFEKQLLRDVQDAI